MPDALNAEAKNDGIDLAIGTALRDLRAARGLSARRLSEQAGVSAAMISRIESGQVLPSISTLNGLSKALGVPLVSLFRETGIDHADFTHVKKGEVVRSTRKVDSHVHEYVNLAFHRRRDLQFEARKVTLVCQSAQLPTYVGRGALYIYALLEKPVSLRSNRMSKAGDSQPGCGTLSRIHGSARPRIYIFKRSGGETRMTGAPDLAAGCRNMLLNCARLKAGDSLLIVHEDPALGWYDREMADALADEARTLGIEPHLLQVAGPEVEAEGPRVDAASVDQDVSYTLRGLAIWTDLKRRPTIRRASCPMPGTLVCWHRLTAQRNIRCFWTLRKRSTMCCWRPTVFR